MQDSTVSQLFTAALDAVRHEPVLFGLAVLSIYFFVRTSLLSRRITRLTRGGDGKTLEGTIQTLGSRVSALEVHAKTAEAALENVDTRLQTSVRGVSMERFDPFQQQSGQQSFATALLNEKGDGVVISGIHSRDGVRVYAKDIHHFNSERELSVEEKSAIHKAKQTL